LISKRKELLRNIQTLDDYLRERGGANVDFARELIQRGVCFAVVTLRGKTFFAPSRFVGYVGNDRQTHLANDDKDGRETNPVVSQILGNLPTESDEMESRYREFCGRLGIEVREKGSFGVTRKFWDVRRG
jgi:hypothetical protein